jgi:WhiB family redox-sensing transcriptional regulator
MEGPQAQMARSWPQERAGLGRPYSWLRAASRPSASSGQSRTRSLADGPLGRQAWVSVLKQARCADSPLNPDEWFPVSAGTRSAREEAAAAIAVCATCPVRAKCLEFSLAHWKIGQYGIWGGLVPAERAELWQAGRHSPPKVNHHTQELPI